MTVNPSAMMRLVAVALPEDLHEHVLLVGSLAAAYHYREQLLQEVATKDADVVVQPAGALATCVDIAKKLRALGWTPRSDEERPPGSSSAIPNLPVVRLYPPHSQAYFIELLAMPDGAQVEPAIWSPIELDDGWYCVPSFRFMRVLALQQQQGFGGLRYAHPTSMALANALAHPELGTQTMSGDIGGRRDILRSAKDLGRVLGIARLEDPNVLERWAGLWREALQEAYGEQWMELAHRACQGLRALVRNEPALEQAHHTLVHGLLRGVPFTLDNLRSIGRQFEGDVLEPLAEMAAEHSQATRSGDER